MATTVTIEIGGRSYKVAPYMLDELCDAAPFIDELHIELPRFAALLAAKQPPTFTELMNYGRILSEIVAAGVSRIDPEMDAKAIRKHIGPASIDSMQVAVLELLRASGLFPQGEAKAPLPRRRRKGAKA